ncbi:protein-L-isoaspartate(D-aspartate) O-methyltransferase [Candidatus Woesearchaeota archaeon]|nr:protein-L-isoaspartate(D-aspartate) O-methyltransferase [Candidatus Woesearchaeota archaeon]
MQNQKQLLIDYWRKEGIVRNPGIFSAFKKVKREFFVLKEFRSDAYKDVPLPIQKEQTISQPTAVVMMLEALELGPGMKVLEIGAGSGYNAALMAEIVGLKGKIITVERISELVHFAKENLKQCNIKNVEVIQGDGSKGYLKEAPYDRIICTAAAPEIPEVLASQLKERGVIVIPVGPLSGQVLVRARMVKGELHPEKLGDFMFVPLKGKFGQ